MNRHRTVRSLALTACAMLFAPGCATAPRMRLARQTPTVLGETVWWVANDPAGIRLPIVAIEHRADRTMTRQILFCDRGVRMFTYSGRRLDHSGPPLPGVGAEADIALVRAALRHCQRSVAAADSQRLSVIPKEAVASIRSVRDVADLLDRYWPAARVEATVGLTYREIDGEMEHFAHGASELMKASDAL